MRGVSAGELAFADGIGVDCAKAALTRMDNRSTMSNEKFFIVYPVALPG
jgi:hypothetical protein